MSDFAPVFKGWNVWDVFQTKDLPFGLEWIGVPDERRARIFVEDAIRKNAAGAVLADPVDFKGSMIENLPGPPTDLTVAARKEDVAGPAMTIDGPTILRTFRFFNRGAESKLVWPHDQNFLLDKVYTPSTSSPATTGEPPKTALENAGEGTGELLGEAAKGLAKPIEYLLLFGGAYFGLKWLWGKRK